MKKQHQTFLSARWLAFSGALALGLLLAGFLLWGAGATTASANSAAAPQAPLADLNIVTVVDTNRDDNNVVPGGELMYTIRYTNTTAAVIHNVTVSDTISFGQNYDDENCPFDAIPAPSTSSCQGLTDGGYQLTWVFNSVPANSHGEIVLYTSADTEEPRPDPQNIILVGNAVKISADGHSGSQDDTNAMVVGPLLILEKVDTPGKQSIIRTVHGVGYRLDDEAS